MIRHAVPVAFVIATLGLTACGGSQTGQQGQPGSPNDVVQIYGAGATFPYPIY
jgi:ABC-type phosphate transport system substrate-binding protein